MNPDRTVAVAMSGGVDSSVAAALLAEQGERVFGLMLRLWDAHPDRPNRCCSPQDMANARRVADMLDIPFYVLDVREPFRQAVVDPFVAGYLDGLTPNPCMACNREVRWGHLLRHALQLGATHLATGHYARLRRLADGFHLYRAVDPAKDQSYVLSVLGQAELARSLFPLGELPKSQVREIARDRQLPIADRHDSQDLCFLGGADYRQFLKEAGRANWEPGPIQDRAGTRLGTHPGLPAFTIGQRKGIGVSAPLPLYVLAKDARRNALIVGPRSGLARTAFRVDRLNWIAGLAPPLETELSVQVRYRSQPAAARLGKNGGGSAHEVSLLEPLEQVTPGQSAVFYRGDECLGGGLIIE